MEINMDIKTVLFVTWKYCNAFVRYNPHVRQWWVTIDFDHGDYINHIQFFVEVDKPENKDVIEVCEAYARDQDRVKNKA